MSSVKAKGGQIFPKWHGNFPKLVLTPRNVVEVYSAFDFSLDQRLRIVPMGQCSRINWLEAIDTPFISLKSSLFKKVVNFNRSNMSIEVESGYTLVDLDNFLQTYGLFFPLDPFDYKDLTVGGAYSTNAFGGLSAYYGTMQDLVIGVEVVTPSKKRIHFGAHVWKNVSGYDLRRFLIGSHGEFGFITKLIFKVFPRPLCVCKILAKGKDEKSIGDLIFLVLNRSVRAGSICIFASSLDAKIAKKGLLPTFSLSFMDSFDLSYMLVGRFEEQLKALSSLVELEKIKMPFSMQDNSVVEVCNIISSSSGYLFFISFNPDDCLYCIRFLSSLNIYGYLLYPRSGAGFFRVYFEDDAVLSDFQRRLVSCSGLKVRPLITDENLRASLSYKPGSALLGVLKGIKHIFDPSDVCGRGLYS